MFWMMLKLGYLVLVYIGSYCLCLDVHYHIKTLKTRLDGSLQVKIIIFHTEEIDFLWVNIQWRNWFFYEKQVYWSIHQTYGSIHTEAFFKINILPSIYRYIECVGWYIMCMSQLIRVWSRLQLKGLASQWLCLNCIHS